MLLTPFFEHKTVVVSVFSLYEKSFSFMLSTPFFELKTHSALKWPLEREWIKIGPKITKLTHWRYQMMSYWFLEVTTLL